MDRERLIREMFEMSREIGYRQFHAENFNRADPVLTQLNPEERNAFLRDWWDAARDRMYESYREQVAGHSVQDLLNMREAYIATLDAIGMRQWNEQEKFKRILEEADDRSDKREGPAQAKDRSREV